MNRKRLLLLGFVIFFAGSVLIGGRMVIRAISPRPDDLGVQDGQLAPCPSYPACVSSQAPVEDTTHAIAPIAYTGERDAALARVLRILGEMEHTTIITANADYIYAEVVTPGFRYTDDVEFYFDAAQQVIHVRSSARVPYYDFQVNRKRVERIRDLFSNP